MNIKFSKATHPTLFQAFVHAIEYICDKHKIYKTRNEKEIFNLIQQDLGVRLTRKNTNFQTTEYTTEYIAHFVNEKVYTVFILRWS
jgi:hypothetical protein